MVNFRFHPKEVGFVGATKQLWPAEPDLVQHWPLCNCVQPLPTPNNFFSWGVAIRDREGGDLKEQG